MNDKLNKLIDPIVITAFGGVTPIGGDYETIKSSLFNGVSGIKKIEKFSTEHYITQHAGLPDEGNTSIHWPARTRSLVGELFYANLAAERLKKHPHFPNNYYKHDQVGCILGVDEPAIDIQLCFDMFAGKGSPANKAELLSLMVGKMKISDCMNLDPSATLGAVHRQIPFSGYAACHLGLCSASLQAIGMGLHAIRTGRIEAAIVGGVSGKVTPVNLARLELIDAISTDMQLNPEARSRPFDVRRSGFVLAEGAVLFFIEKLSNVRKRQENGLLSLLGYGSSLAAQHIVATHTDSLEMELCMRRALKDACINVERVDVINAHGTSTVLNDVHESVAIHRVFGNYADQINVVANKSLHGHLIAAAGAMEVLNTLISVNEGFIPGTINLCEQDGRCRLNVLNKTEKIKSNIILKNSFGMGGLAASMVLGRVPA